MPEGNPPRAFPFLKEAWPLSTLKPTGVFFPAFDAGLDGVLAGRVAAFLFFAGGGRVGPGGASGAAQLNLRGIRAVFLGKVMALFRSLFPRRR